MRVGGNTKRESSRSINEKLFEYPQIQVRIRFWRYQWFAIPLLLMIPLAALFGYFGKTTVKRAVIEDGLSVDMEFPEKLRYGQNESIKIHLKNISPSEINHLRARVDSNYIEGFSDVNFIPQAEKNYEIPIGSLSEGEVALLSVRVKAGIFGKHKGKIHFYRNREELFSVVVNTYVFP